MADNSSVSSSSQQQRPQSALWEVLKHWKSSCLEGTKPSEDLRKDSKTFFRYLVKNTSIQTDSGVALATRSSHEEALAKLVQELGPAFSSSQHVQRIKALYTLVGALEGCHEAPTTHSVLTLLGNFLSSHCGPIDDDEYGEDYDNQIRDAAILGLKALVLLSPSISTDPDRVTAIEQRLNFAKEGVEKRCALPRDEQEQAGFDSLGLQAPDNNTSSIRGGLSTLPRSKRSLCFDLVQAAIHGVSKIQLPNGGSLSSVQPQLISFSIFAATCIHGESDPRCLLQLLQLLHSMQIVFEPFMKSANSASNAFPTVKVFDAVAPYFPIQFSPPPNNVHGITREGLHSSLLSVLTYTGLDTTAQKIGQPTMVNLSTGLFLELLLPMDPDDRPTVHDRKEAIECLMDLFFTHGEQIRKCDFLDRPTVRSLSQALIAVHNESSLAVGQGGEGGAQNKLLADSCRTLVSKLAFQLELSSTKGLWDTFVVEPLQKSVSRLRSSPAASRTAIAYVACLAASGGSKTLRFCLKSCLDPLIDVLEKQLDEYENSAAAAYGVGAFFSSCRVAMDRATEEGVVLHPHPLEPYSARAFKVLFAAFEKFNNDEDGLTITVVVGVVRGLESVMLASPADHFKPADFATACRFVDGIHHALESNGSSWFSASDECLKAYRMTLGSLLGNSFREATEGGKSSALISVESIREHFKNTICPKLVLSVGNLESRLTKEVSEVLTFACSAEAAAADFIVSLLLEYWLDAMEKDQLGAEAFAFADALTCIFEKGGKNAALAYHHSPNTWKIIDKLASLETSLGASQLVNMRASISNLALPETMEEKEALKVAVAAAYEKIGYLLPAYRQFVPRSTAEKLVQELSQIMPPLSDADTVSLYVLLPLLSASLHGDLVESKMNEDAMETNEKKMEDLLAELSLPLAEFALGNEYEAKARAAAASCLHAAISLFSNTTADCPIQKIQVDVVNRVIRSSLAQKVSDYSSLVDALKLSALLGTAGASKGGKSVVSSSVIAKFLLKLACAGESRLPFEGEDAPVIKLQDLNSTNLALSETLKIAAASAYGSMISTAEGPPLAKQRLVHMSQKHIRSTYEKDKTEAMAGHAIPEPEIGLLIIVSHILCSCDLNTIEKNLLQQMTTIEIEGLSSSVFAKVEGGSSKFTHVKSLVLAAILKLICVVPHLIPGRLTVVKGLLRAYGTADPASEVGCKLLSLQALEQIASMEGAKDFAASIQPAVVSIVAAATNHPSGLLRQAAVDVRNAWFLISD